MSVRQVFSVATLAEHWGCGSDTVISGFAGSLCTLGKQLRAIAKAEGQA